MAINRNTEYGARWAPSSAAHPQGAFLNRSGPSAQDGSYLEEKWMNDLSAFNEALLNAAGITVNNTPDEVGNSQYMQGLVEQVSGRSYNYDCAGGPFFYVLSARSGQYAPQSYFDGLKVEFTPSVTNSGSATINVAGLGVVQIADTASGGELDSTVVTQLRYSASSGQFHITHGAEIQAGVDVTTNQQNGGTIDQTFENVKYRSSAFTSGPTMNSIYSTDNATYEQFDWQHTGGNDPHYVWSAATYGALFDLSSTGTGLTTAKLFGNLFSGSGGDKAVPNSDNFLSVQSTNGYQRLPGNLIIQWIKILNITATSSKIGIWATPFTTIFTIMAVSETTGLVGGPVTINTFDTNQVSIINSNQNSINCNAYVWAIGTKT